MIAWLHLNRCPVRPNSLKLQDHGAPRIAGSRSQPKLLHYASLLYFYGRKSHNLSTGHRRSATMLPRQQLNTQWTQWYISQKDVKPNLKCFLLLGGTKGEVSYLLLFGLKHSQQYPTSLPIWFTLSMSLSWMHSSSLNSWVGVVRLRQRKQ